MKKRILLAIMILSLCMTTTAFAADGNVTYSGNSGKFIFAPGSDKSPTDLFPNFKDVMPGDTLTQKIVVKNNAKKSVKISMRALGAHEDSEAFLSQLNLYVEKVTDTPLFEAPANETAQLTAWKEIGVLAKGGEAELQVALEVPTSLNNDNKNLIGYLDWEFMVEEIDDSGSQTGDEAQAWTWLVAIVVAGAVIVFFIVKRRKDSEEMTEKEERQV